MLAIYIENSAAYSGIFWLMEEKWMQKATALSTHAKQIENSRLRNAPWDIGSTSERHYSRRKKNRVELAHLNN